MQSEIDDSKSKIYKILGFDLKDIKDSRKRIASSVIKRCFEILQEVSDLIKQNIMNRNRKLKISTGSSKANSLEVVSVNNSGIGTGLTNFNHY